MNRKNRFVPSGNRNVNKMQKKDTLRNALIAGAVFALVLLLTQKLLPPPPQSRPSTPASGTASVEPSTPGTAPAGGSTSTPANTNPPTTTDGAPSTTGLTVVESEKAETVVIGADEVQAPGKKAGLDLPYRMRLTLSNVGASLESARMSDHAETASGTARYEFLAPVEESSQTLRSLAIEKINIDGADLVLSDKKWRLVRNEEFEDKEVTGQLVEFAIDILNNNTPLARVSHTFRLPKQARELSRHDLYNNISVENLTQQPHQVVVTYRGGTGIRRNDARMDDRFIDIGVRTSAQAVSGTRTQAAALAKAPGSELELYSPSKASANEKFSWAGIANTYFTCTVAPLNRARNAEADYIGRVSAFDADGVAQTERDLSIRFVSRAEQIAAGARLDYPSEVYIGQKDSDAFNNVAEYNQRNYYFQVSQGFGYCTFGPIVTLMIWLLDKIHWAVRDYGIAIIVLVLLVRTLLHPITKKGQVNMVRMQHQMSELQPKIEEIKRKFGNDKVRMNQEMMKLNINPAGQLLTCLPMLIQMPIWVALFLSLSHNIDMRHEPFLFTWIRDLTSQDALVTFNSPIVVPLFGWVLPSFNLLPLLVALTMYIQQKLMPKPKPNPNMTEEQRMQQEMMQKMMPMMSIMMLFIFYKMPSGLNLYIMSSSIFGSIEQWRIRKHIKEREEAGTLHKKNDRPSPPNNGDTKRRGGGSFFERLQDMAEQARKAQRAKDKR